MALDAGVHHCRQNRLMITLLLNVIKFHHSGGLSCEFPESLVWRCNDIAGLTHWLCGPQIAILFTSTDILPFTKMKLWKMKAEPSSNLVLTDWVMTTIHGDASDSYGRPYWFPVTTMHAPLVGHSLSLAFIFVQQGNTTNDLVHRDIKLIAC